MALPVSSQITLKPNQVKAFVNEKGDTLIAIRLADAKHILTDVLNYQITDSLVKVYEAKNNKQNEIITVQKELIDNLKIKIENKDKQLEILTEVIKNKDKEITLLNDIIKQQKKEIVKQKLLKLGGFGSAIILPVITALILLK